MIVLMHANATEEQVNCVVEIIARKGLRPVAMPGGDHMAIGIASAIDPDQRESLADSLRGTPGVSNVVHVSRPYKLVSREFRTPATLVRVRHVVIGGPELVVMAGPCAIESRDQLVGAALAAKAAGARVLRGGAFKPRTSPYSFQGLQGAGLRLLADVGAQLDMATVTEVVDPHDVDLVSEHADMLQIGARNMQNYALLIAAGKSGKPVLLKRGPSATIDELLFAAEYILHEGNDQVVLCERGVLPLDRTYTRNTLDVSAVPVLKEITHLPVVVDPSHATGRSAYVPSAALAAVAAGADGLIVEVHPRPREALSDGQQSLTPDDFAELMAAAQRVAHAVGRIADW
jgi:3-deoxy-7-phosphoheptulonate synthase